MIEYFGEVITIKRPKAIFSIILCLLAYLLYDFYIGSQSLVHKTYDVKADLETLKVINVSDIHYGFEITDEELDTLIEKINDEKPDVLVFSGDLIDSYSQVHTYENGVDPLIDALSRLKAPLKVAVYGNHDYYCNTYLSEDTFRYIMESSGFTVLRNETVSYGGVDFIGLDNYGYGDPDYEKAIEDVTLSEYQVVLVHEPDYIKLMDAYDFDLYLAGHSHGGQIWIPFYGPLYTTNAAETYVRGAYSYSDDKTIIVSTGVGETKVKYRLFNPPSFDVIKIGEMN